MRKAIKLGDLASILAECSRMVIDRCLVLAKYMMYIRYIMTRDHLKNWSFKVFTFHKLPCSCSSCSSFNFAR